MIRFICREDNAGMAANVGGEVETKFVTIDGDTFALEAWLTMKVDNYTVRHFVGIEIVAKERP